MTENISLEQSDFSLKDTITTVQKNTITQAFSDIEGVEKIEFHQNALSIFYFPFALSKETIREELKNLGMLPAKKKRRENRWNRFINRLAESNEKTFGTEPLDCCKLNSGPRE